MTTVRDLHRTVPTTRRIDRTDRWQQFALLVALVFVPYALLGAFIWGVAQW